MYDRLKPFPHATGLFFGGELDSKLNHWCTITDSTPEMQEKFFCPVRLPHCKAAYRARRGSAHASTIAIVCQFSLPASGLACCDGGGCARISAPPFPLSS